MKICVCSLYLAAAALPLLAASCVQTVAPDGTKTTSFQASPEQIHAARDLIDTVKAPAVTVQPTK
ncbi:MAG: hypothetical protein QM680_10665 [Luteolibacter sp.]